MNTHLTRTFVTSHFNRTRPTRPPLVGPFVVLVLVLVLVSSLLPGRAGAAAESTSEASPTARLSLRDVPIRHQGLAVSLGAGVTGYTDANTRSVLGTGGTWEVRGLFGTRSILGSELAYVGSERAVSAPGVSSDAVMLANGVELAFRLNLPLQLDGMRITPFIFGGPGFSHLSIERTDTLAPDIKSSDNALVLTTGAGISFSYHQILLGLRFTYRQMHGADLIRIGSESVQMQSWSTGLSLGYEI